MEQIGEVLEACWRWLEASQLYLAIVTPIGAAIVFFFRSLFSEAGKDVWSRIKDAVRRRRLDPTEKQYRAALANYCGALTLYGEGENLAAPMLDEVFVDLAMRAEAPSEVEPSWKERPFELGERVDIRRALDEAGSRATAILGPPGCGKTTLTRQLARAVALRKERGALRGRLPIYIELRRIRDELVARKKDDQAGGDKKPDPPPFTELAATWAARRLAITDRDRLKELFRETIKNHRALIILDGVDELDLDRSDDGGGWSKALREWLTAQATGAATNPVVVSSRPRSWATLDITNASVFDVLDLTADQVRQLARDWLKALAETDGQRRTVTDRAKKLVARIETDAALREMTRNPLLLTMAIILGELPKSRRELLDKFCDLALHKMRKDKDLDLLAPEKTLRRAAEKLAWAGLVDERRPLIPRAIAIEAIDETLKAEGASAERFLAGVGDWGLMRDNGDGTFEFAHNLLRDCLAASHAHEEPNAAGKLFADAHREEFRECALLFAAQGGAGSLMKALLTSGPPAERLALAFDVEPLLSKDHPERAAFWHTVEAALGGDRTKAEFTTVAEALLRRRLGGNKGTVRNFVYGG